MLTQKKKKFVLDTGLDFSVLSTAQSEGKESTKETPMI